MRRKNASTEFLKECMADALFRLLKEKPLEEITVTEITDLADVGRVTFYRNFNSKEDLIKYKFSVLRDEFFKDIDRSELTDTHAIGMQLFSFVYSIRDILNILYQANLAEPTLFSFSETIRQRTLGDPAKTFHNAFLTFGITGIITEWIRSGFHETPEELMEILESIHK